MLITDLISPELIQRHLSAEFLDDTDRDYVIGVLLPAAWSACEFFLNTPVYVSAADAPKDADNPQVANAAFIHAVLICLGDYYLNREDVASPELNKASTRLLWPMRRHLGI